MLLINGVQLYQSKQSDCWIYIWVLMDLTPELCYNNKYVLPGSFIPGPNKPKNLDYFMYTGLHHLVVLQERQSMYLGLPNGTHLYITSVLILLGECQWTWLGSASWLDWASQHIWVLKVLWAQRKRQAQGFALLPCVAQAS